MAAGNTEENLAYTSWRHDAWLAGYPLLPTTVLDYFALSPFYDRNCNNEKARMQGLDPSKVATLGPGLEFVVQLQDCQPPHLFLIVKQLRKAVQPNQGPAVQVQSVYYVLDGTIYQAPTLHAALQSRMKRCLHNIKQAFSTMKRDLDPLVQGQKLLQQDAAKTAKQLKQRIAAIPQHLTVPSTSASVPLISAAPSKEQMQMVGKVLFSVMESFPLPNAVRQVQQLAEQAHTAAAAATDAGTSNQPETTATPPQGALPRPAQTTAAFAGPPAGAPKRAPAAAKTETTPTQPAPKRIKLTIKKDTTVQPSK